MPQETTLLTFSHIRSLTHRKIISTSKSSPFLDKEMEVWKREVDCLRRHLVVSWLGPDLSLIITHFILSFSFSSNLWLPVNIFIMWAGEKLSSWLNSQASGYPLLLKMPKSKSFREWCRWTQIPQGGGSDVCSLEHGLHTLPTLHWFHCALILRCPEMGLLYLWEAHSLQSITHSSFVDLSTRFSFLWNIWFCFWGKAFGR